MIMKSDEGHEKDAPMNATPNDPKPATPTPRPARPPPRSGPDPRSVGPANAPGMTTIDPIRVLRQYLWYLVISVIVGVVVGVIGHFAWLRFNPTFTTFAVFEVHNPVTDAMQVGDVTGQTDQQIERRLNTEAQQLVQSSILRDAINAPDVQTTHWISRFKNEQGSVDISRALEDLKSRARATPSPDTYNIRLSVSGNRKEDVKRLCDAIVAVYVNQTAGGKEAERSSGLQRLSTLKQKLQNQLRAVEQEIEDYLTQNNVSPNINVDPIVQEVTQLRILRSETSQALTALTSQAAELEQRLMEPELIYTNEEVAIAESDPKVYALDSALLDFRSALTAARENKGAKHPQVRMLENQVLATENERESVLLSVLDRNITVQYESAKTNSQMLETSLAEIETDLLSMQVRLTDLSRHRMWLDSKPLEKEDLISRINGIENSQDELNIYTDREETDPATLVAPAFIPDFPEMPKKEISLFLGVILITGLTTTLIFLRELTDKRIKGPADISILPHGRVLGVIPHLSDDPSNPGRMEFISTTSPQGVIAESVRQVRTPLLRMMDQNGHKILLAVGGQPGAGTSSFVMNLAVAMARTDRRVLVIDANFRRPRMATAYGLAETVGLGDVLAGEATPEQAIKPTDTPGISLLVAGSAGNRIFERLGSEHMTSLLSTCRSEYDIVLIDSPSAVAAGDSQVLAHKADASVLIVRAMNEERGLVSRLIRQLREGESEFLGVVLNAARSSAGGYFKRNFKQMAAYGQSSSK